MQQLAPGEWIEAKFNDSEMGCGSSLDFPIAVRNNSSSKRSFTLTVRSSFKQRDELIEWFIGLVGTSSKRADYSVSPSDNKEVSELFQLEKEEPRELHLVITTPKGGFKKDSATFAVEVSSADDANHFGGQISISLTPVIVAVKTTVGNEMSVARDLTKKGDRDKEERSANSRNATSEILAIMSPKDVKGYIFVETMHPDRIPFLGRGIRGYKGEVKGEISIDEIAHYLIPKPAVTGLELGAFVELIDGPFKGEKAKIMAIDSTKEEVTVQLIESLVPIPVTVRAEAIRMLDVK